MWRAVRQGRVRGNGDGYICTVGAEGARVVSWMVTPNHCVSENAAHN